MKLRSNTSQISIAYIDPGNYATDVAAGASHQFQLLFIVLLSNIIAIYLQSLCIKLGTVSGMDLAQMCRAHFPGWLNIGLYIMAEAAVSTKILTFITASTNLPLDYCNRHCRGTTSRIGLSFPSSTVSLLSSCLLQFF